MKHLMAVVFLFCAMIAGRVAAQELQPGLIGEYFNIGEELSDYPTIAADKKPTVTKVDKTINFDSTEEGFNGTDLVDQFYIRWTGVIKVPKDGKYKFYTESDDGSRVFIDGKQVVDNGGLHAMEEKEGEVELKAGDHDIKVEFFENGGGAGIKLSWEADGISKDIVPEKVLFSKKK
ncbi:MAG TPA: PA14 domain-containing protein [Planctomycetota bacterium]|nr:PA14 domain-containing protein [Planctomycetota bacterium]